MPDAVSRPPRAPRHPARGQEVTALLRLDGDAFVLVALYADPRDAHRALDRGEGDTVQTVTVL